MNNSGQRTLPPEIEQHGNPELLHKRTLAIFCSVRCPGNLIVRTYDFVRMFHDPEVAVVGGFHSPMEKECLILLLRNEQPVIVCPARSITGMRMLPEWTRPFDEGRLLLLSPFKEGQRRATEDIARARNDFVVSLADEVLVAHAAPGSKTEAFCRSILQSGTPLLTFDSVHNASLIEMGASVIEAD